MEALMLAPMAYGNGFKLGQFFESGAAWLNKYGCYIIIAIGIIAIIAALGIAVSKFLSKGQSQFKWIHVLGLVIVAAIAISTGISGVQNSTAANITDGTGQEIVDVGSKSAGDVGTAWE